LFHPTKNHWIQKPCDKSRDSDHHSLFLTPGRNSDRTDLGVVFVFAAVVAIIIKGKGKIVPVLH
jgi:hypothetical protein